MKKYKVILISGGFDPVHKGHIELYVLKIKTIHIINILIMLIGIIYIINIIYYLFRIDYSTAPSTEPAPAGGRG